MEGIDQLLEQTDAYLLQTEMLLSDSRYNHAATYLMFAREMIKKSRSIDSSCSKLARLEERYNDAYLHILPFRKYENGHANMQLRLLGE